MMKIEEPKMKFLLQRLAKNQSVFCGKLGERIASEKVTAIDDGTIPNAWAPKTWMTKAIRSKNGC